MHESQRFNLPPNFELTNDIITHNSFPHKAQYKRRWRPAATVDGRRFTGLLVYCLHCHC